MNDNTITPTSKTLTSEVLRQALDRWCEKQPEVIKLDDDGHYALLTTPKLPNNDPGEFWRPITDCTPITDYTGLFAGVCYLYLTLLAIEHSYTPWLRLAASLPYTGAKAAQLALKAIEKGLAPTQPSSSDEAAILHALTDDSAMGWD